MTSTSIVVPAQELSPGILPPKPTPKKVAFQNIPAELRGLAQWVVWKYEPGKPDKTGKRRWTKVPYKADDLNRKAKSTDPSTWVTFEKARDTYLFWNYFPGPDGSPDLSNPRPFPSVSGVGFVLVKGGGIVALDGDHVRDEHGVLTAEAKAVVEAVASYPEESPGRDGLRIIVKGHLPDWSNNKTGCWEAYDNERFMTITGQHLDGAPMSVEARQEALEAFCAEKLGVKPVGVKKIGKKADGSATSYVEGRRCLPEWVTLEDVLGVCRDDPRDGDEFVKLFDEGDTSDHAKPGNDGESEADWALLRMLARRTGPDPALIDEAMRRSALARDEWDTARKGVTKLQYQIGRRLSKMEPHQFRLWQPSGHETLVPEWPNRLDFEAETVAPAPTVIIDPFADKAQRVKEKRKPDGYGGKYEFKPMTSAAFAAQKYTLEWLVKGVIVYGEPAIIGGPKKCLKTNILTDLAISIGSGTKFLGKFDVKRCRVAFISGESGAFTLQETARRICKAKGIDLADVDVLWDFRLPKLAVEDELEELSRGLASFKADVVIVDPLYLCLLSGDSEKSASNLFDMGPLLLKVARACLDAGAMPMLAHHAKKGQGAGKALDLEDLAFAGVSEFARQWCLLSRRKEYDPDRQGDHRLWLTAGGSVGHSGLWGLNIDEGVLNDDFTGRKWDVDVLSATEVKLEANTEKVFESEEKKKAAESSKEEKEAMYRKELVSLLGDEEVFPAPPSKTKLRAELGWGLPKFDRVLRQLVNKEEVTVTVGKTTAANGSTQEAELVVLTLGHVTEER